MRVDELVCDQCQKRVDNNGGDRNGWIHIERFLTYLSYGNQPWIEKDFCNLECLRQWVGIDGLH